MSKRSNSILLEDMLLSSQKIKQYVKNLDFNAFLDDEKTKDAVVRNFQVLGEAANRLEIDFRRNNSKIEWDRIRGFRNRIVHEYFGIDYRIVWEIIEDYLEELITELKSILQ